ncbi:MAG: hypothetical protein JXA21_17790, partial [Anaerolineae bacterium]|nr:hypothetical protein [Anaerolineae bacterium]
DAFSVQVWPIYRDAAGVARPLTDAPRSLGVFSNNTAAILPAALTENIAQATHLAIIVTRLDTNLDAKGEYAIGRLAFPGQCDGDNEVECARQWIATTLFNAGIISATDVITDPPVPALLFATTPYPRPANGAQAVLTTTTAPVPASLTFTRAASHTLVAGDLQAAWTTSGWSAAQFVTLTAGAAEVWRVSGSANQRVSETLLSGGPVTVVAREGGATALAVGELLAHAVSGRGALAFYAPATSGLGAAGT